MPTEEEDLQDLQDLEDEGGGDEEEEEEDEPETAVGVGLAPERIATPPEPEPVRKRKRGRPKNPENVGKPPKPSTLYLTTRDVENLWPQVIVYAKKILGIDPFGIDIRVKAISPQEYALGTIPGASVTGDLNSNPGSMLVEAIVQRFHIPMNPQGGQAQYKVEFIQRSNGSVIKTGSLTLPPVAQIMAMRQQKMEADFQHRIQAPAPAPMYPGAYPNAGYGAPPPSYGAPYPYYPPAPSPAGVAGSPDMTAALQELAFLRGTLQEAHQAAREGRQWQPPPVAPPPPPSEAQGLAGLEDRLFARIMTALQPAQPAQSAGVGAPPSAPSPIAASSTTKLNTMVEKIMGGMLDKAAKSMEEAFRQGLGLGASPPDEPAIAEVMSPEDSLPFSVVPIPEAKWPDGRPVNYVRNKDSGSIDLSGALHSNPWVVEKAMDMANGIMGAVTDAVKNVAKSAIPGQAQVVSNIPRSAVNGGAAPVTPQPPTATPSTSNGVADPAEWPRV